MRTWRQCAHAVQPKLELCVNIEKPPPVPSTASLRIEDGLASRKVDRQRNLLMREQPGAVPFPISICLTNNDVDTGSASLPVGSEVDCAEGVAKFAIGVHMQTQDFDPDVRQMAELLRKVFADFADTDNLAGGNVVPHRILIPGAQNIFHRLRPRHALFNEGDRGLVA